MPAVKSAPNTATPPTTAQNTQAASPSLPFAVASRSMTRFSFSVPTTNLQSATNTPVTPISVPAMGYLAFINLEVTLTCTGASATAADGPFNALQNIEFRTAAGNDIIVPTDGYTLYLVCKYGAQFANAPYSDVKLNSQYSSLNTTAHFFLQLPFEIDPTNGMGSLPALASNRSYQLYFAFNAYNNVWTGGSAATGQVNGTAYFWSQPVAQTQSGITQETQPPGLGTVCQIQQEQPPLTPGDKYIKSNNVGNSIRMLIFVCRNSSNVRIDTNGWPSVSELYLDNDPQMYLTLNEWSFLMAQWFGLTASSKDVATGGLDTGVYVLPFYLFADNQAFASASRAQYLPTLDASLLQLRGTSWGSAVSTLQIITQSVIPVSSQSLYANISN